FLAQLPHARVDEREAGDPFPPRRERIAVVDPAVAARTEVLDLGLRPRVEELRVEVAPAELPRERVAAALAGPNRPAPPRDAAEVEVRREPRGRVIGECVMAAGAVAVEMLSEPGGRPLRALALAAARTTL